jgi:hypothetical protein
MEHSLSNTLRNASLVVIALLFSLGTGCGDGLFQKSGGDFSSSLSRRIVEHMGGAEVDLVELTGCEVLESNDPEAHCEGVSGTQIEVFLDGESIIFDFSNVTKGGKISASEFEGYLVSVTEHSRIPKILEAILDATQSTIDSQDLDIQFDDKSVAVNFQGLDYDDATFIKIDLVFDDAT